MWRLCGQRLPSDAQSARDGQERFGPAFHASSRLCCPFSANAVDWLNAHVSAASYRRVSAACRMFTRPSLAGTCPGEVGHDDAANGSYCVLRKALSVRRILNVTGATRPIAASSPAAAVIAMGVRQGLWRVIS